MERNTPSVPPLSHSQQRLALEAEGWLELKLPDEALPRIERLLRTSMGRPLGLHLRVRAFVELARYRDALRDLDELEGYEHDAEWLDVTEAWCRKRIDDLDGAIDCMRRLIERNRRSAIGHFNLGCYLALAGHPDEAINELTLACGIDPTFRKLAREEKDLESLHDLRQFPRSTGALSGFPAERRSNSSTRPRVDDDRRHRVAQQLFRHAAHHHPAQPGSPVARNCQERRPGLFCVLANGAGRTLAAQDVALDGHLIAQLAHGGVHVLARRFLDRRLVGQPQFDGGCEGRAIGDREQLLDDVDHVDASAQPLGELDHGRVGPFGLSREVGRQHDQRLVVHGASRDSIGCGADRSDPHPENSRRIPVLSLLGPSRVPGLELLELSARKRLLALRQRIGRVEVEPVAGVTAQLEQVLVEQDEVGPLVEGREHGQGLAKFGGLRGGRDVPCLGLAAE